MEPLDQSAFPSSAGARPPLRGGLVASWLHELEGPQSPARRHMDEVGVRRFQNIDAARAAGDRDVLLAVMFPGDRLSDNPGRGLKLPEDLAGVAVHGDELAGELAGEHEAA